MQAHRVREPLHTHVLPYVVCEPMCIYMYGPRLYLLERDHWVRRLGMDPAEVGRWRDAPIDQGGMDLRGKAQRGAFDPASLMPADALKVCAAMTGNSRVLGHHARWEGVAGG